MKFLPFALFASICLLIWGCIKDEEKPLSLPVLTTNVVSGVTLTGAVAGGTISGSGNLDILERGVCYSDTTAAPTLLHWKTSDGAGTGSFSTTLSGLKPNTTYYVRAYARNQKGITYANTLTFETLPIGPVPVLATIDATQIGADSCLAGGSIASDGGFTLVSRGVCWAVGKVPTINDFRTKEDTSLGGDYLQTLPNLNYNTTYFFRAYATNSNGTGYGALRAFTTKGGFATLICKDTNRFHDKKGVLTINGSITFNGNGDITERGFVIATFPNPTLLTGTKVLIAGEDYSEYLYKFTNLRSYTKYYVRSYAVTSNYGAAYSDDLTFSIEDMAVGTFNEKDSIKVKPTIALRAKGKVTKCLGMIKRGFVWGLSPNPTVDDNMYVEPALPTDTGRFFYTNLTGLLSNHTYYFRAFAQHDLGIGYGVNQTIKTLPPYTIGQTLEGGRLFLLNPDSSSGMVVAAADQPTGTGTLKWGCRGNFVSTDEAIGSGRSNTLNIISVCPGSGTAAYACSTSTTGTFRDWFLPSKLELQAIMDQKAALNLNSKLYWSSTQFDADSAFLCVLDSGRFVHVDKDTTKYFNKIIKFRPVRRF